MALPPRIDKGIAKPARAKPRAGMSEAHLDNIRSLLCLGCGREPKGRIPIMAHHLITGMVAIGERGQGRHAADRYAVPLCTSCHLAAFDGSVHWLGSDELFFSPRNIDPRAIADALWREREDFAAMWRIVFRARQTAIPVILDRQAREWRRAA